MIPECEHHQVLRVGEPQRLQQGPVDGQDGPVGDAQREADLLFEGERVDFRRGLGHIHIVR